MMKYVFRLKRGDSRALESIYDEWFIYFQRIAIGYGMNDLDFEELFNDILMEIWTNRMVYEDDAHLFCTIALIIEHKTIDGARVKKYQFQPVHENHAVEWMPGKLEMWQDFAGFFNIDGEIDKLPPKCRKVMELFYRDGLTVSEIVKVLGIAQANVSKQKRIGTDKIKAIFKGKRLTYDLFERLRYLPFVVFLISNYFL